MKSTQLFTVTFDWSKTYGENKTVALGEFQKEYVTQLLNRHKGNITRASAEAKMDRKSLHGMMVKHKLQLMRIAVMDRMPVTRRSDV